MADNRWRDLMAKVDQRNKIRTRLGNQWCEIEDIIRPVGLPRRDFRRMKARLERLEAAIESFDYSQL